MAEIYVGMSGWTFDGWRGGFYPKGLVQRKELEFASRQVNSIEINGTFYALQKPASYEKWFEETPKDFLFAVKAPRFITHIRRLKNIEEPLANFYASGIFCLKHKMGPVLWQFPPNMTLKDDRFEKFLELLPHDSKSASRLAKKHSARLADRNYTRLDPDTPIRHAFELRHESFKNPQFLARLRHYGVAVVFGHAGGKFPYTEDVTADFIYARMHGQGARFKKGYGKEDIEEWAQRVESWTVGKQPKDAKCVLAEKPKAKKRAAFIYFDTEAKEHAPSDALNLSQRLGLGGERQSA